MSRGVLISAVDSGDIDQVRALLAEGIDLSTRPPDQPLLYRAVSHGYGEIAALLLDAGAPATEYHEVLGGPELTALQVALESGYLDLAMLLVDHGADPDEPLRGGAPESGDDDGVTFLWLASEHGRLDLVRRLLDKDIIVESPTGSSAIEIAATRGNQDLVECIAACPVVVSEDGTWRSVARGGTTPETTPRGRPFRELMDADRVYGALLCGMVRRGAATEVEALLALRSWSDEAKRSVTQAALSGRTPPETLAILERNGMLLWGCIEMAAAVRGGPHVLDWVLQHEDRLPPSQRNRAQLCWGELLRIRGGPAIASVIDAHLEGAEASFDGGARVVHRAALTLNLALVEWLIDRGVDLTARDDKGRPATAYASRGMSLAKSRRDVQQSTRDREVQAHEKIMMRLLEAGCPPADVDDWPPLPDDGKEWLGCKDTLALAGCIFVLVAIAAVVSVLLAT